MSNNGQVPDQRLAELQEQLRKSTEMVNQLKGTIDTIVMQQRQPQQQQAPRNQIFKPEVEQGINEIVAGALKQQQQHFGQAYNALWEKNDKLEFTQLHGREALEKYEGKIDELRRARQAQGQFISRDEAYRYISFEETNRKPKPLPDVPRAAPAPQWDPYLNKWVLPDAAPVQASQPAPVADQNAQPTAQNQQQTQQVSQQNQQPMTAQDHVVQPNGQVATPQDSFALPTEGSYSSAAPSVPDSRPMQGLDMDKAMSDPKYLDTFAAKYGDVPL